MLFCFVFCTFVYSTINPLQLNSTFALNYDQPGIAPAIDQKVLENAVLQDATTRLSEAATADKVANDTYENILNLDAATEAEIKAEASRRVAEAAAKIAKDEELKARNFAGMIKTPVIV